MLDKIDWLISMIINNKVYNFRILPAFYIEWSEDNLRKIEKNLIELLCKYKMYLAGYIMKNIEFKKLRKSYINYLQAKKGIPLISNCLTIDSEGNISFSDAILLYFFNGSQEGLRLANIYDNNWREKIINLNIHNLVDKFVYLRHLYEANVPQEIKNYNQCLLNIYKVYFDRMWLMIKNHEKYHNQYSL